MKSGGPKVPGFEDLEREGAKGVSEHSERPLESGPKPLPASETGPEP